MNYIFKNLQIKLLFFEESELIDCDTYLLILSGIFTELTITYIILIQELTQDH